MTDQERLNEFTKLIGKPPRRTKFNWRGQLIELDLAGLELTELPPQIGQFQHLTHLYLGGFEVKGGKSIELGNPLTSLPAEVGQLRQLQRLYLTNTQLMSLPAEVGQLQQLKQLNLRNTPPTSLPAEVGQLQQLQRLDFSNTKLTSLPAEVGQLQQLQWLDLTNTKLRSLPAWVGQLQQLQRLYLSNTQLTNLPAEVGQLQQLQRLYLSSTQLTNLPAEVGQLQQLQQLEIQQTKLTSLPAEVGQLEQLQYLSLTNTQLTSLPAEIIQLNKLQVLDLRGTNLPMPPEILDRVTEVQTILDYYFQAHQRLNEAKLLLVGQGGVGKTSLVKRLTKGRFSQREARTEGINIQPWQIQVNRQEIRLNIWDFGGQEIMHATHQFFLTHRSLYLLVLDARQGEQEGRLEYWLKMIRSFGGDSPVIIVLNKCDQHHLTLDQRGLKYKYYPNLKGFVETSCLSGAGVAELKEHIRQELAKMAHVGDLIPLTWFAVKRDLEVMETDYLPYHEYQTICDTHTINRKADQSRLIRLLHDLGIALNYPDPRLQETNVLKPQWVTNGIYQIVNSPQLAHSDGMLKREQLSQILDSSRYPASKQLFIIDMMRKFELCFMVEGTQDEQFLIPDLLPKEQPDFTWSYETNLGFEYHYDILPGSILSRFIVRMHSYVLPQKAWRSGVVLADDDNQALILADREDGKIYISVGGQERSRRAFLAAIRFQFDHIHRTITGIKVQQMVPLISHPKETIAYHALLSYEKAGELNPWWPNINARLDVKQLLDGVGRIGPRLLPKDKHRLHRANEPESREIWRDNRWLRAEKVRQEEVKKAEEERKRLQAQAEEERKRLEAQAEEERKRLEAQAEEERKRLEAQAEEERRQAQIEQKQKSYEKLRLMRPSVICDAQRRAKRLTAIYLLSYISFCMVLILILFGITYLLSDELFNRLGLAIDVAIAMIILPTAAWAASHYLKLESLWPTDVLRQLQKEEFERLCNERHFPEAEYQQLRGEFGD